MTWPAPIRIVGLGSPHGDDALGWEVVRILREQLGNRPGIESHLAGGSQRLLELLDGRGTLVLIDAAQSGAPPGTIHCFEWPDPRFEVMRTCSTHDLKVDEALWLAQTLAIAPGHVIIFALEIESTEHERQLGQGVRKGLQELVELIGAELKSRDKRS
jgi:hydrogenase maturation protease